MPVMILLFSRRAEALAKMRAAEAAADAEPAE
jgi:hypothetical protein